jgi:hypothetical protein
MFSTRSRRPSLALYSLLPFLFLGLPDRLPRKVHFRLVDFGRVGGRVEIRQAREKVVFAAAVPKAERFVRTGFLTNCSGHWPAIRGRGRKPRVVRTAARTSPAQRRSALAWRRLVGKPG